MTTPAQGAPHSRRRGNVRSLKQRVKLGVGAGASTALRRQSQDSALALLDRSILFGHRRLAVLRLRAAIEVGAVVTASQWAYCMDVARTFAADASLKEHLESVKSGLKLAASPQA